MARIAFAVLGRAGGIRGRSVEHCGLYHQRFLYGVDKFAGFILVHSSGEFVG